MTRRGFLRLLGLAPAGVAAAPQLLQKMATKPSWPWAITGWWQKEFDWGNKIGTAIGVRNVVTGEIRRNAVRFFTPLYRSDVNGLGRARAIQRATAISVARLKEWAQFLNDPWRRNALGAGVVGDDVLEGREQPL